MAIENENEKAAENNPATSDTDNVDYINAISEMKKNSVSKDKYDQLVEEKNKLIKALVEGGQISPEVEKEKVDVNQLRTDLYSNPDQSFSNLDYIEKTLKLRNAIIDEGGADPFLPNGKNYRITQDDINKANLVAEVLQSCVDYADGDSQLFTQELMRCTKDDGLKGRKR